ncbi:hypothetical protein XFC3_13190 [Xylella fastidiosa]|nr:hypothetical protein XFC3_13190 [Xylella fastidiosa]
MLNVFLNDLVAVPVNSGTDTDGVYPACDAFSSECGFTDAKAARGFPFAV